MCKNRIPDISGKTERYSDLWKLSRLVLADVEAYGILYLCDSVVYGECVLKICLPEPEFETGLRCLLSYGGRGYVKVCDYDLADCVLLMERIRPGNQMWKVKDYRERARIFAGFVKDLPIEWDGHGKFPTYRTWMEDLRAKLIALGERDDVLLYLDEAQSVYDGLKVTYSRQYLLHGDLHQGNMLLNSKGGYTVIDPKGVIGDPVMETARYLMNESPCEADKIREIIGIISSVIGIPESDLTKGMFIDAALGQCWELDEPFSDRSEFYGQLKETLGICEFAYGLL